MSRLKDEFKELNEGALTIPNLMSLFRIVLIPFFVFFFIKGEYIISLILVFISGLTDLFDGKIARHFNQISKLGKLLDPAADKLTQVALAVILFTHFNKSDDATMQFFSYVFLLFCLKELSMIIGSFVLLAMGIVPTAAEIYGKVATFSFYIVIGILLCFAPGFGVLNSLFTLPHLVIIIMVSVTAVLTIIAFFAYLPDTIRKMKSRKNTASGENETENENENESEKLSQNTKTEG